MNPRIRQLAEQALIHANKTWNPESDPNIFVKIAMEKHAELIVRECMNAVCDPRTTYLESMTESSAMYTARERIRKHFGG